MNIGQYSLIAVLTFIASNAGAQAPVRPQPEAGVGQTTVRDTSKPAPVAVVYATMPPAPDSNIRVYEPPMVKNVVQKMYDYQRCLHGMSPGFRVQIDFGQERNAINKTKSDFALKYPAMPAYIGYKQPYFKMSVGDFRTRLDAVRFLNTVKKDYPAAFIVSEKIEPPPL